MFGGRDSGIRSIELSVPTRMDAGDSSWAKSRSQAPEEAYINAMRHPLLSNVDRGANLCQFHTKKQNSYHPGGRVGEIVARRMHLSPLYADCST